MQGNYMNVTNSASPITGTGQIGNTPKLPESLYSVTQENEKLAAQLSLGLLRLREHISGDGPCEQCAGESQAGHLASALRTRSDLQEASRLLQQIYQAIGA